MPSHGKMRGPSTLAAREKGLRLLASVCLTLWLAQLGIASAAPNRSIEAREHTVASGETLSAIAARYGVSVTDLASANGLSKAETLKLGRVLVIPGHGVVYVAAGDTIDGLAKRYAVSRADLLRENKLTENSKLRVGQAIVVPGAVARAGAGQNGKASTAKNGPLGASKQRGLVSLYRLATRERKRLRLVDTHGKVSGAALTSLKVLLRPRGSPTNIGKRPNPRLVKLIAQVSDHFGGREIEVISGYRRPGGYTKTTSRHVAAEAIDFRIPGIPLEELHEYCAHLSQVGVGFYPVGQFVHLDVRKENARWTDWSGPGEAPVLVEPGAAPEGSDESATAEANVDERPEAAPEPAPPEPNTVSAALTRHAGAGLVPR